MNNYEFMPFNYVRRDESVLLVNAGGGFVFMENDDFTKFVNRKLSPDSGSYETLKSNFFLYEGSPTFPIYCLATQYRTKKSFLRDYTSLHMVVVTVRCNQKCKYCQVSSEHADAHKYDMTKETATKAVDMIFKSPSPYIKIEFQGGEPFLNFATIKHIVKYAKKLNQRFNKYLEFVVCTNLVDVKKKHLMFCNRHNVFISTSLDGPEKLHNSNRPLESKGNTYQKVAKGIRLAKHICGEDSVCPLMTTTRDSLGNFREIIDEYISNGFNAIFLRPINPYGMAKKNKEDLCYSVDQFVESYKDGLMYIFELNLKGTFFVEEYARLLLRRMLTPFGTGFVDLQSPSGAGISGAIYDYNGNVYAADEGRMLARQNDFEFLMGTVDEPYHKVFMGEKIKKIVNSSCVESLPCCNTCAYNIWCGADPVRNYTSQNDYVGFKPTSEFCKKNSMLIEFFVDLIHQSNPDIMNVIWSWLTRKSMEELTLQEAEFCGNNTLQ